jgi:CRP-like cAMP-binding protein
LSVGQALQRAQELARNVYFVESGLISLHAPLSQGKKIEVGLVGREGAAGVNSLLGSDMSTSDIAGQGAGWMWVAPVKALRRLLAEVPRLRDAMVHYAMALHVQVAQTAACNAVHAIDQRLARWLLTAHDRAPDDKLEFTHEGIANTLGVTRPGVTIAAGALAAAGLIVTERGRMRVINRPGLVLAACECYGIVADYYYDELNFRGRDIRRS